MIGLIDADSIPYIICYNKVGEPEKTYEECVTGVNQYLMKVINRLDLSEIHLFFTLGQCFRYEVFPEYKVNRVNNVKPNYFTEIRQYLIDSYNGIFLRAKLEADDLLCIYKKKYNEERKDYIVVSIDKDVLNLCGINYNPNKDELNNIDLAHEESYFWKSMIIGDNSDGIKGIPRKGEVFANNLLLHVTDVKSYRSLVLNEYIEHYGEDKGINEFYKNYKLLKIKDSYEDVEFINPVKVKEVYARTIGVVE